MKKLNKTILDQYGSPFSIRFKKSGNGFYFIRIFALNLKSKLYKMS